LDIIINSNPTQLYPLTPLHQIKIEFLFFCCISYAYVYIKLSFKLNHIYSMKSQWSAMYWRQGASNLETWYSFEKKATFQVRGMSFLPCDLLRNPEYSSDFENQTQVNCTQKLGRYLALVCLFSDSLVAFH